MSKSPKQLAPAGRLRPGRTGGRSWREACQQQRAWRRAGAISPQAAPAVKGRPCPSFQRGPRLGRRRPHLAAAEPGQHSSSRSLHPAGCCAGSQQGPWLSRRWAPLNPTICIVGHIAQHDWTCGAWPPVQNGNSRRALCSAHKPCTAAGVHLICVSQVAQSLCCSKIIYEIRAQGWLVQVQGGRQLQSPRAGHLSMHAAITSAQNEAGAGASQCPGRGTLFLHADPDTPQQRRAHMWLLQVQAQPQPRSLRGRTAWQPQLLTWQP